MLYSNNISNLNKSFYYFEFYVTVPVVFVINPLIGIVTNTFVISLCLNKQIVNESFKCFVLNLALADYILSWSLMFQLVHIFIIYNETVCIINGFLVGVTSFWMSLSLFLLPFCRYIRLYNKKLFSKCFSFKSCFLMCLFVFLIATVIVFTGFMGGQESGNARPAYRTIFCSIVGPPSNDFNVIMAYIISTLVVISFVALIFFCYKLHQKIKQLHKNAVTLNQNDRLEESKALLKVSLIQGFLPIASIVPTVLRVIVLDHMLGYQSDGTIIHLITVLMVFGNPVLDALSSLFFIRPFKRAMEFWFTGIKKGKLTFAASSQQTQ